MKIFIKIIAIFFTLSSFAQENILNSTIVFKNQNNEDVKLSQIKDDFIVLTMGYTECKKTCPQLTIKTLKEIESFFNQKNKKISIIMISLDPEHDTPAELKIFKDKITLNQNWHFLVTTKSNTREISKLLGFGDYWTMDDHIIHGFKITVFDTKNSESKIIDWNSRDLEKVLIFKP